MRVKCKVKVVGCLLAAAVLMINFVVATPKVHAVPITIDFDALDTSDLATVGGAALDSYLAGFGVTLTNTFDPTAPVFVGDSDNDINAVASSGTNWLGQT